MQQSKESEFPTFEVIRKAQERIRGYVHRTPVCTSTTLNAVARAHVFCKCENFQKVGAFKARGAINAVFALPDKDVKKGVATHSSGNHAAALAYAARCRDTRAYVVMPENSPEIKKAAVADYGAEIVFCKPTLESREIFLAEVVKRTGAIFIHPYDHYHVICGQATAALELIEQTSDLDTIIAPVGGGGLLSGTALAAYFIRPQIHVVGAEPQQADDAFRSFAAGKIIPVENPQTIADGLRTSLGTRTFPIIAKHVHSIVTVSEKAIIDAMRLIWERMKIVVEPSAAVPVAALLEKRTEIPGERIGVILSGGNADLEALPWSNTLH